MTAAGEAKPLEAKPLGATALNVSRVVVPLLGLAIFINYVDRGNLATAAPLMKDELHLTSVQIGVLISAFSWTYTPGQLFAGWLGEKLNPYRTLALGLAIWALATAAMGVASGFVAILVLRLLLGLGETAAFPCSSKIIAQHLPPEKLGAANSIVSLGLSLGPAFGTLAGGLMMASLGWRPAFIVFGLVSLLWLVPWLLATRGLSSDHAREAASPEAADVPPFLAILKRPELWGASLGHFSVNYGFYFVISWLPIYLVKVQGFSMAQMAGIGSLIYLTYAAGSVLGGQITDRWMIAGATANKARKTLMVACHAMAAVSFAACALGSPPVAIGSLFVSAIAFGACSPNIFAIGQTLAGPRVAGKWIGVQNCFGNVAGIVGPIITGFLLDSAGGFPAAFGVAAGVAVLGMLGWGVIIPKIAPVAWPARA